MDLYKYNTLPRLKKFLLLSVACCFFLSCAAGTALRLSKLDPEKQTPANSLAQIRKNPKWYGDLNKTLYHMDLGILYHYNNQPDSAALHLSEVSRLYESLFTKSVTNEGLSILTNDNIRPYRPKHHEMALVHAFGLANFLTQGKTDAALVESRQAQLLFDEWRKQEKKEQIYTDDPYLHLLSALAYDDNREGDNAAISAFQSARASKELGLPLSSVSQNLITHILKNAGRESDLKDLGLSSTTAPNTHPKQQAKISSEEIIVLAYGGRAPVLGERAFWATYVMDGLLVYHYRNSRGDTITDAISSPGLPQKEYDKANAGKRTRSGTTLHLKFSLPELQERPYQTSSFGVYSDGQTYTSESVLDLKPLLNRYLQENKTAILTRTVIRVALRTLASQATKSNLKTDNPLVNLLVNVSTDVLADQLEQADTRSWFLLPAEIHLMRIPAKEGENTLNLAALSKNGQTLKQETARVHLKKGERKYILFHSLK